MPGATDETPPRRRGRAGAASCSPASRTSRPGVPIVLDPKGLRRASRTGDLARRPAGPGPRPRRARARQRRRGSRTCSRRCSSSTGARVEFEPLRAAEPSPRGPRRPARAADDHDRPRDREGLRRRALVPARARRDPRLGAHRRRLVLRPRRDRRSTSAPPSARSRPTSRASSRRCCRTSSPTTPARCGRIRTGCASRSRCRRPASRASTAR